MGRVLWRELPDTPEVFVPLVPARPVLVPGLAARVDALADLVRSCERTEPTIFLLINYTISINIGVIGPNVEIDISPLTLDLGPGCMLAT